LNSLRRFRFHRQHYLLHYGLLFLATALGIGGSLLLLNLLEPFANFGRSTHALVRPLVVLMNNGIAWILEKFQVYQVYPVPFHLPSIVAFLVPLAFIATLTTQHPWPFVAAGVLLVTAAAAIAPRYLRDPWEYDLGKLGSKSSDQTGAGEWSNKANTVFGGKMNVAGARMLADSAEQVPLLKKKILDNDASPELGVPVHVTGGAVNRTASATFVVFCAMLAMAQR